MGLVVGMVASIVGRASKPPTANVLSVCKINNVQKDDILIKLWTDQKWKQNTFLNLHAINPFDNFYSARF